MNKELYDENMSSLQDKINEAKVTMLSFWSNRKEVIQREQEEKQGQKVRTAIKRKLDSSESLTQSKRRKISRDKVINQFVTLRPNADIITLNDKKKDPHCDHKLVDEHIRELNKKKKVMVTWISRLQSNTKA